MDTKPDQCCRECLTDLTSSEKYSFQCPGIKELFENCTNLVVSSGPEESHLPQSICSPCYSQCEQWLTFRDECHENDRFLRSNAFEGRTTANQDANRDDYDYMEEIPGSETALLPVQIKYEPESESEDGTLIDSKIDIVESDSVDFRDLQVPNPMPVVSVERLCVKEENSTRESTSMEVDVENDDPQDSDLNCPVCLSKLPEEMTLQEHLKGHVSEEDPKCPICSEQFNRSSKVYPHILSLHSNKANFKSGKKQRVPVSQPMKKKKTTQMKGGVAVKRCPLCSETVPSLYHHLSKEHVNPRDIRCPICQTNCLSTHLVKSHLLEHTNEIPFSCEICFKTFKLKYDLGNHLAEEHRCFICKRVFSDATKVKAHMACHTANDKTFGCREQIDRSRIKLASAKRPAKRPLCQKEGELTTEHIKPGDKKCPICGIRCKRTAYLKVHLMMHTGERNFACEFCDARFNQRWSLVVHLQRHHPHSSDEGEPVESEPRQLGLGVNIESKP